MTNSKNSILKRAEGHEAVALPAANECGPVGALTPGDVTASPAPITTGPLPHWREQADGFFGRGADDGGIEMRQPSLCDLPGIVAVVRCCKPWLTPHVSYMYWMQVRLFAETCAVAEAGGEIVGWCSAVPSSGGKHFIHQLGVIPDLRRHGVARSLLAHLVSRLTRRLDAVEIEFTIDRKNGAALDLVRAVVKDAGMSLRKAPETVELMEADSGEELYVMTSRARIKRASVLQ